MSTLNRKRLLKRLDRYIIGKFLGTYFLCIVLIVAISVVFDYNEHIDHLKDAPLHRLVFDYYLNFIPYYANLFSPLFVFISVIFFTSKLADNTEIIAMFSNGLSFKRMLLPYMLSAAIIAGLSFTLIVVGQIVIVSFGGEMFSVVHISLKDWLIIILGTSPIYIVGDVVRLFIKDK